MSTGVNKVILLGNLGADPDLRYTPSGQAVCHLSVATHESWNDKNGQRQERTEWHRVIAWGKRAEVCSKYLTKGRQVFVEGRLQHRSYDDKDGIKRYTTEVVADNVQFIGGGGGEDRRSEPSADGSARDTAPPTDNFGQDRGEGDRGGGDRDGGDRSGNRNYGRHAVGPEDDLPF
jgi:single-strand DNA-binding protein